MTTPPPRQRAYLNPGNILLYLAEKFGHFLPKDPAGRTETLNWLFWLQGAAPFLGGGFGHFYNYAPVKIEYAIDVSRWKPSACSTLDKQLARGRYVAGEEYTIADSGGLAVVWLRGGSAHNAAEFPSDGEKYTNVQRRA